MLTNTSKIQITVLGSGTSMGVPTIACNCPTCTSDDPKDFRMRSSLLIESETTTVLIDTSSDFRAQMLKHKIKNIDAILFTHHHFDHISGFDDIRPLNFINNSVTPIYATEKTLKELRRVFVYAFEEPEQIGGGVPHIEINTITPYTPIQIGDIELLPIRLWHGKLEVMGFIIKDFAYCTDTNCIPDESLEYLKGKDTLIIDALRHHKHETHFCLPESLEIADNLGIRQTYFTHIAHQIKHSEVEQTLPEGRNLAYDGLTFYIKEE